MLTDRYTDNLNQRKEMEFNNISKEMLPWLEDIALEHNCKMNAKNGKANTTAM